MSIFKSDPLSALTPYLPETEVSFKASSGFRYRRVLVKINLFIFYGSPESLHKDVVVHAASAIHADPDPFLVQLFPVVIKGAKNGRQKVYHFRDGAAERKEYGVRQFTMQYHVLNSRKQSCYPVSETPLSSAKSKGKQPIRRTP